MTTIATRVLLVDDDEDLRHAHLQTLRLAEAPARGFAGGEDALRHIDRAFAGVVVTDVRMPGMDGLTVLKEIKKRHPLVEVIILTGHASVEAGMQGMSLGAYDYVLKPVDFEELLEKTRKAYERKKLNEARNTA